MPSKEKFYSSLTGKKISEEEYDHVLKIWNKFEIKTMKDYHDLYLKRDVLLLGDVFEIFRNDNLKNYGLCPSHYLSAPALSWNAMLNRTKVEVELIPDTDRYIFFEKGTRVGVSYISNIYSTASKNRKSKHIIYLESNNLYSYAISKFHPTCGFK